MGDTDSFQPVILLAVTARQSEDFVSCEARILWYSTDTTSSRKLRDTTHFRRVALTRAKSRALRDALNIDLVTVEELGKE